MSTTCSLGRPAEPFIVDWAPDKRGDVELAQKHSVIAAKVTCDGVELLGDCQVDGEYLYAGTTEREELLSIRDGEDLRPSSSLRIVAWLGVHHEPLSLCATRGLSSMLVRPESG